MGGRSRSASTFAQPPADCVEILASQISWSPLRLGGVSQQIRRVKDRKHRTFLPVLPLPTQLGHTALDPENRFHRSGSHQHDHHWVHQLDLKIKPGTTAQQFALFGPAIAGRTALDGVADVQIPIWIEPYLAKQGLSAATLSNAEWTKDAAMADKVAAAVLEWATENDATTFTHAFQPQGASGVRHGLVGMVQNAFFKFDNDGVPVWDLKGKDLIQGETDGSSYPSGGLRATHTAGGYTVLDPTSPVFLRGDTVYIPTVFVSFYGDALDEKVIEAKGNLKKLMTGDEVTELLSSLEMGGEPVWGLSTKERRLVREAKEKTHAV